MGKVVPSDLIRTLQSGKETTDLARAFAELGKLYKTLHILEYIDDRKFRREILRQLNIGESRHALIRAVNYGGRGHLKKRYLEQQQEQMEALTIVVNSIVFWNSKYISQILNRLRSNGYVVKDEDVARLSPLVFAHINIYGRYYFELAEVVARGGIRLLQTHIL